MPPPEDTIAALREIVATQHDKIGEMKAALVWARTVIRPGSDLHDAMNAAIAAAEKLEKSDKRGDALRELITAARAQHDAIDNALAMLEVADRELMRMQSPIWATMVGGYRAAMVQGHAAILKAEETLK